MSKENVQDYKPILHTRVAFIKFIFFLNSFLSTVHSLNKIILHMAPFESHYCKHENEKNIRYESHTRYKKLNMVV